MDFLVTYGVWIIVGTPAIAWELLGFAVRRGVVKHPTLSQMIKASERHQPKLRFLFAALLLVLFGHLVWPTF